MASADSQERNLVRKSGVIRFNPKDDDTTSATRDAGVAGAFGPGSMYNFSGPQGAATKQFSVGQKANIFGAAPIYGGTTSTGPTNNNFDMNSLAALLGGSSGSGATGLGYAELAFKKQQDARDRAAALEALQFGRARDARTLAGFQDYYGGGEGDFNKGFNNLLDMIKTQGEESEGGITKAYDRATTNIGEGYKAASGLGTTGFNALNQYLAENQNNPYAGMQASVGSAPDALSSYLSAYGVSDQPVQGQIQADQLQAQQGAGNYQNLIDLLGATAQQGAASRGAESQMAQLLFNTGLGQDRAGYTSQAENAQAQALAALQQQMFQSRFGVEGDRNNLANQLVQTILNAGGNYNADENENEDEDEDKKPKGNPNLTPQVLAELAARRRAEF